MCFAPQQRALFRHPNLQKWSEPLGFLTFWLGNVLRATTACTFSTSQLPKVVRTPSVLYIWLRHVLRATTACTFSTPQLPKVVRSWGVLYILTCKCASRHNCVHFFDISISKRGPNVVCFVHFDLEMCFAPQRRALFWHLNFQKWSEPWCVLYILTWKFAPQRRALFRHRNFQKWSEAGVFCTFWLANVLRATTACNFSSLIWPAGSAPAALASLLFDPPEPQIIGKTQCFLRLSYLFAHLHLLSSYSFSSTLLSSNLSLLSASSLLCFSSVHIVGSLTSKLPSINIYMYI